MTQIRAIGDLEIVKSFTRAPAIVSRHNPYVLALRDAVGRSIEGDALSIGRDGASDAISFLEAGIPAVEFGPVGGGHHGPHEWVSISSLALYRRALGDFVEPPAGVARAPGAAVAARRRRRAGAEARRPLDLPSAAGRMSSFPDEKPPRVAFGMYKRFAHRGRAHHAAHGRDGRLRGPARGQGPRRASSSDESAGPRHPRPQGRPRRRARRQAPDDPRPGLRPALRRHQAGQPGALGHDDARAAGPVQGGHRGDEHPARPQGADPGAGRRHRHDEDQRRLLLRRPGAGGQDRPQPAAHPDQPRRQRELRGLPARRQPPGLRVRRRRQALLPLQRGPARSARSTRRSTSPPATRSCAARSRWTTCASATPTTTSCARRASRTSCARPRTRSGSGGCSATARSCCGSSGATPTPTCTRTPAILRLLKLAFESSGHPIREVRFRGDIGPEFVTISPDNLELTKQEFLHVKASNGLAPARPRRSQAARARSAEAPRAPHLARAAAPASSTTRRGGENLVAQAATQAELPALLPAGAAGRAAATRPTAARASTTSTTPTIAATAPIGIVVAAGLDGQYYGVQGMTWKSPPILDDASEHHADARSHVQAVLRWQPRCAWCRGARRAPSTGSPIPSPRP